ncbi:ABC transporter ATP-binding protein [Oceanidesulfovibrio marinus]|uniref:ABC transporter ATP-binding protein n=1 Tax=Oceanidesulfovibrio marinus TaxID=370038 RepID=A0ABX6NFJ2_9BACT|nr:ABC transporter ATP-binding protein [Oceanidesulfovibrio marinus]QJT08996.1 ABC transporter ATP-binding protein [Oceanidesulfovibrio marinus]
MYLELKGIRKEYDGFPAVDQLDLQVHQGELLCILGPSGCGKSTTIGMVGGFIPPTEGAILLEGKDVTRLPPNVRPTCTVFQNYALFPHMTVLKNVVYGLKFRKIPKKEALKRGERMLEAMDLYDLRSRKATMLSGGEQQRVALARSMILEPKVLLLDEPLSNLDAKLRFHLRRGIKELQERTGVTMFYVTHDQEEALGLSDRMVVMNRGRIEQTGPPESLYTRPATSFVAEFLGRVCVVRENGRRLMVRPEDMFFADPPGRFTGRVQQRLFSGPITTYFVNVGQERPFEVDVLSNADSQRDIGETVYIDWRRDMSVGA